MKWPIAKLLLALSIPLFLCQNCSESASSVQGSSLADSEHEPRDFPEEPASQDETIDFLGDNSGATDVTLQLQEALDLLGEAGGGVLQLPAGTYRVSTTLHMKANIWLRGEGIESTRILRTGTHQGDTIVIGSPTTSAGASRISDLWFLHERGPLDNSATTLENFVPASTEAAHLRIYASQLPYIERVRFWYLPYGIVFHGGSIITIRDSNFMGIWDHTKPGFQESIASVAFLNLNDSPSGIVKDVVVSGSFFSGANSALSGRFVTYGSKTIEQPENIGPKYGIFTDGIETASFTDNYFGAQNENAIYMLSNWAMINHRITNNFFDAARIAQIMFQQNDSSHYPGYALNIRVENNIFNGQGNGRHGIISAYTTGFSLMNFGISNNNFLSHAMTPILLHGAKGGNINGNIFTNYNIHGSEPLDPTVRSGLLVNMISDHILVSNNNFGGGGNDLSEVVGNGTYWGLWVDPQFFADPDPSKHRNIQSFNNLNTNLGTGGVLTTIPGGS